MSPCSSSANQYPSRRITQTTKKGIPHPQIRFHQIGRRSNGTASIDILGGADAVDKIYGYGDDDILGGHDGADRIFGGDGGDVLHGGDGSDRLDGGSGDDSLFGDAGHDRLDGGDGYRDTLDGGAGDDRLRDRDGLLRADGGAGDDRLDITFQRHWNAGNEGVNGRPDTSIGGGSGSDTINVTAANLGYVIAVQGDDAGSGRSRRRRPGDACRHL